jgi:hypothetical protein
MSLSPEEETVVAAYLLIAQDRSRVERLLTPLVVDRNIQAHADFLVGWVENIDLAKRLGCLPSPELEPKIKEFLDTVVVGKQTMESVKASKSTFSSELKEVSIKLQVFLDNPTPATMGELAQSFNQETLPKVYGELQPGVEMAQTVKTLNDIMVNECNDKVIIITLSWLVDANIGTIQKNFNLYVEDYELMQSFIELSANLGL